MRYNHFKFNTENHPGRCFETQLLALQQELARWRQRRIGRRALPEPLWQRAAQLAHHLGRNRVSAALKLNYYSLKKRQAALESSRPEARAHFIEMAPVLPPPLQCRLECAKASGDTLSLNLAGDCAGTVLALAQAFWEAQP